jgi:hypothetical protein
MSDIDHGTASNSATQPTASPGEPTPEQPTQAGTEKDLADACLAIVQRYRTAEISKAHATLELHDAFPHALDQESFVAAYGAYLEMLDNVDHFRDGATQHAPSGGAGGAAHNAPVEPPEQTEIAVPQLIVGASKRARPANDSDDDDEGYGKRTRLDFDALPWNQGEEGGVSLGLSPSLQKTQSLLANFAKDLKRAKSSLLNCGKSYPQFPDSEWGNLLAGKAVDLDHVLSGMHSVTHEDRESHSIGKGLEIIRGSSKPARSVHTHGEWIMAYNSYVEAATFIFPHRALELRGYGNHIMRYFASSPVELHDRIVNYDKAVRIRVAQRRDLELTNFEQFSDLHLQWINNPAALTSSHNKSSRKPGQRREPCRRWNEHRCPNSSSACSYAHICPKCRSNAHVGDNCPDMQRK